MGDVIWGEDAYIHDGVGGMGDDATGISPRFLVIFRALTDVVGFYHRVLEDSSWLGINSRFHHVTFSDVLNE